jgi:hypothetical protein
VAGLVVHGGLEAGERVLITGAHGGVGHVAVQLVRALGGVVVEQGEPCDLLFDTVGGKALAQSADRAGRVVTIAAEVPGAQYFVVEPDGAQLAALPELHPDFADADHVRFRVLTTNGVSYSESSTDHLVLEQV